MPANPPRPQKILVVDDMQDVAESFAHLLTAMGHTAKYTTNSGEALDLAKAFQPDLAFLDLGMPKPDGLELCSMLRGIAEFKGMSIVAITAYGSPEHRRNTRLVGFDAHVQKPVDHHVLQSIIEQLAKDA